ncbi:MAG TPA: hypothetical protein VD978_24720 [Azospirillum sp.]|nr:hypothetical protein [Azospirillum sp.]
MLMDSTVQLIIARFPAFKDLVVEQFAENARFRSLCNDYAEALAAQTAWEKISTPQASLYVRDYRRLVAELERDLLRELLEIDTSKG